MTANRPTNFFARQRKARRNCRNQITGFVIAVAVIVLVTTLAIRFVWYLYIGTQAYTSFDAGQSQGYHRRLTDFTFFDPAFFLFASMIIVMIILAASLLKMSTLKKGGGAVAEMLGGRRIGTSTADPAERRLTNVVEEMAIASGIPVPQIYVLDGERNINAFAAGLELSDSAVAVTRGALTRLTRDELQGVIGHEFSHILNGDSRLNVQLIGILFGILFMGIVGRKIVSQGRLSFRMGLPVIAGGLSLMVIGYIGTFTGRLLQCAISRQREFLADASAVQFTRNPLGLAGALKKIGGSAFGSNIQSPEALQASHLFFSEIHQSRLFSFLATHPPLIDRIRLLDPSFDGKFVRVAEEQPEPQSGYKTPFWGTSLRQTPLHIPPGSPLLAAVPADVVTRVGQPKMEHIEQSRRILSAIPEEITRLLQTPEGAACVIYALLMDRDAACRAAQESALDRVMILQGQTQSVSALAGQLSGLGRNLRLPLIELAVPALRGLTSMEKRNFLLVLQSFVNADGCVSLFELSVLWILNTCLNPAENLFKSITVFSFSKVGLDIVVLLGALASAGHVDDRAKAEHAFGAGLARIPELAARKPVFSFNENLSYARVHNALTHLGDASFKIRESVIDASAHCAFDDAVITADEGELLRVIALALECPLPPFAAGAPKSAAA
ncbi:MAG: hypothetical protein EG826_05910 [Deltaproteobacteria bacterium]|nr:hypothetical protein [Deltaproteobacteria bacterium]